MSDATFSDTLPRNLTKDEIDYIMEYNVTSNEHINKHIRKELEKVIITPLGINDLKSEIHKQYKRALDQLMKCH